MRTTKDTTVEELLKLTAPPAGRAGTSVQAVGFGPSAYAIFIQGEDARKLAAAALLYFEQLHIAAHKDMAAPVGN